MPSEPGADLFLPAARQLRGGLLFLALVAAGLLGNYFEVPLFFGVDFVFGSFFAMLALQRFGWGRGVLAGLLISSPLILTWGHPYATLVLTAEVAVVGWVQGRRRIGYIQADALFWLLVGMPASFCFYHLGMKTPLASTYLIVLKGVINGLANTVAARLVFSLLLLRRQRSSLSFRETIYTLLVFFVLVPSLALIGLRGRTDFAATEHGMRSGLQAKGRRLEGTLDAWVANREHAVVDLAALAAPSTPRQMQPRLEQAVNADWNLMQADLLDANATMVAAYPPRDEAGLTNLGKSFADRPYLSTLRETRKPFLSELVLSRVGAPRPIVLILAPVLRQGAFGGYVAGVLSLDPIREQLERDVGEGATLFTLLDRNGRTILSNRPGQRVMAPLDRGPGRLEPAGDGLGRWVPDLGRASLAVQTWGRSSLVLETGIGTRAEWRLVLEQPVAPFQVSLFRSYAEILAILLVLLLATFLASEVVSRQLAGSFEQLGHLTQDLPGRLKGVEDVHAITWPQSGFREVALLISNFMDMAASLTRQFQKVMQANESLEQRVQERTRQLRESEEHLRHIMASTGDGIYGIDRAGLCTFANAACVALLGYAREKDLLGLNMHELVHHHLPDGRPLPVQDCRIYMAFRDGVATTVTDEWFWRRDGSGFPVEYSSSPLGQTPRPEGAVVVFRDITERLNIQAQLQQSQKMESLGSLAGGLAHDINNALGAILGVASANLQDPPSDAPDQRAFRIILKAAERSGKVIKSLLNFARQTPPEQELLDLNGLLRDQALLLEHTTLTRIKLVLDLDPDLPPILGDPSVLSHCFMNLCVNALDAMAGTGTLTLRTRRAGADRVQVAVVDTGCGMTKAVLARAQDPFFTTKEVGKGTGLGLAMAFSAVEAHRGRLELQSEPGRGTTVLMHFPAAAGSAVPADPPLEARPAAPHRPLDFLVVDDDELLREAIRDVLHALGHHAVQAASGEEALAGLRQGLMPDAVILDLNMPGMGGAGALPLIRALRPELPVLLATGRADLGAQALVAAHPGVTLLAKPFTLTQLKKHLEALGLV